MDAFVDDELASPSPSKIFNGNLYTCPVNLSLQRSLREPYSAFLALSFAVTSCKFMMCTPVFIDAQRLCLGRNRAIQLTSGMSEPWQVHLIPVGRTD
jgi:hypothetical protein